MRRLQSVLRDTIVMGTGCLKVYEGDDNKVCVDRVLVTDLYVDENDSMDGDPQQLIQLKLMDRIKLLANSPRSSAAMIAGDSRTVIQITAPIQPGPPLIRLCVYEGWKSSQWSKTKIRSRIHSWSPRYRYSDGNYP